MDKNLLDYKDETNKKKSAKVFLDLSANK